MGASKSQFRERYTQLLDTLALSTYQKDIIRNRYIEIVIDAENDHKLAATTHYILVCTVTVSGVIIGSLLVLNKFFVDSMALFWLAWAIAIVIALSNKLLYSFNVSKKYILNRIVLSKLYSEGWMFLTGGGKYKRHLDLETRFAVFCERIEKIKLKSIESASEIELVDTFSDILATSPRPRGTTGPVDALAVTAEPSGGTVQPARASYIDNIV